MSGICVIHLHCYVTNRSPKSKCHCNKCSLNKRHNFSCQYLWVLISVVAAFFDTRRPLNFETSDNVPGSKTS